MDKLDIYPLLLRILNDREAVHAMDTRVIICFEEFGVMAGDETQVSIWGPSWVLDCMIDPDQDLVRLVGFQGDEDACYRDAVLLRLTF